MEFDNGLEDGELSDDSGNDYTPLERPTDYAVSSARLPQIRKPESESDGGPSSSSSSDSDSDTPCFRAKKPKIKVKKKLPKRLGSKKDKYNIWSSRAQEDSLLAINSCDVTLKDRSRDVETYDHTIAKKYYKELNDTQDAPRSNNKRSRTDRNNSSLRLTRKKQSSEERDEKQEPRILLEIVCNSETMDGDVAIEIANKLYEEKEDLIVKVVSAIGRQRAIEIYNEVKRIEADGGMLIMNQSRRRTPGGVYLFLLKHDNDLTEEQRNIIFEDEKKNYKAFLKAKKKKRTEEMKLKISASKVKNLPELLTKADLVQKLSNKKWTPKEDGDNDDVVNPPPTPETDGLVDSEGMETHDAPLMPIQQTGNPERLDKYETDYLDLSTGNDMDMF